MIQAKIVADSVNEFGNRITTMVVTMPRIILAEFNTHRMFSRNSASSRAIPFEKMVKSVEENPFIPIAWQKEHKGMQGTEYFTNDEEVKTLRSAWLFARSRAIDVAEELSTSKVTKQLCNRLLEPFMWHQVIVTATEWENFFALRCPIYIFHDEKEEYKFRSRQDVVKHFGEDETVDYSDIYKVSLKDLSEVQWLNLNKGQAEIHMMALAEAMYDEFNSSIPKQLKSGEWHIPFGDNIDKFEIKNQIWLDSNLEHKDFHEINTEEIEIKIATARCARVSYTIVGEEDKKDNYENDIKLHDRLLASGHMSPFEHCGLTMNTAQYNLEKRGDIEYKNAHGWSGNFRGFIQYRKTIPNENITK